MSKAKKLYAGRYEYKGYDIEKMYSGSASVWHITELKTGTFCSACDGAETLKGAKTLIDRWTEK